MDFNELMGTNLEAFKNMDLSQFLLGQLSAFENRHQASVDSFYKDITWKQYFAIICIRLCGGNPTIKQLSEVMGSSHQNVKQILLKLEKKGFVQISDDVRDKRKQRISITKMGEDFCGANAETNMEIISELFEGIPKESILETTKVICMMEKNLRSIDERRLKLKRYL